MLTDVIKSVLSSVTTGLLISTASPAALFSAGEVGAWYDPSDLTTMFQDSAGTIPVTAVGQPVGLRLDKSGRGNHASQSTPGSRAIYASVPKGGIRNLLVNTPFAGAIAGSPGSIPTGWTLDINNASIAVPSADVIEISAAAQRTVFRQSFSVAAAEVRTFSCNVEVVSGTIVFNQIFDMTIFAGPTYTYFMDGSPVTSTTIIPVGSHVLSVTIVNDATLRTIGARIGVGVVSNSTAVVRYTQPQFEAGSTATNYQRVGSIYDITEAGVKTLYGLLYDGLDDFYVTPTITPGTDKVQVFAGVRTAVAQTGLVLGFGAFDSGVSGGFGFINSGSGTAFAAATHGGTASVSRAVGASIGVNYVFGLLFDHAQSGVVNEITYRRNGTLPTTSDGGAEAGTANYAANPLYIGRRGGTSLPYAGYDFGLIVRFGANLSAAQIVSTEAWLNTRTGAY